MERSIKEQVGAATWQSWPVGAHMVIADAQATIAALQARVKEVEQQCGAYKLVNDMHMKTVMKLSSIIESTQADLARVTAETNEKLKYHDLFTQRTAELHQILAAIDEGLSLNDIGLAVRTVEGVHAELERVRLLSSHNERRLEEVDKKYKELHGILLALPKVEGEIVERFCTGSYYSSPHDYRSHVTFETALVALLKHRQGMEG